MNLSGTPFDEAIDQDESDMMRNDSFRIEPAISGDRHEGSEEKASVAFEVDWSSAANSLEKSHRFVSRTRCLRKSPSWSSVQDQELSMRF